MTTYEAIVIGAGHNGLTCAAYLARAGLSVLVLERRKIVGGSAATEEVFPSYQFDTCAHRINGIHPSVSKDLQLHRHGLEITRARCCVFAPTTDGRSLTLWTDVARTVAEIRKHSLRDAERWPEFVSFVNTAQRFLQTVYDHPPVCIPKPQLADVAVLLQLGRQFRQMTKNERIELMRVLSASVADFLSERFESQILNGAVGAAGISGIFQGPMAAGTAYVFLHNHVYSQAESIRPTYFVRGGIGGLSRALDGAARAKGVSIRTGTPVRSIVVKNNRAVGVALADGDEVQASQVISSADPRNTFLTLLGAQDLDTTVIRHVNEIKFRGATAKVNLALGEMPQFVGHNGDRERLSGTITISPSLEYLERAFDDAKYGSLSSDPFLDIVIPTVHTPAMAPDGKHVMSVAVQYAPFHLANKTWSDSSREQLGDRVVTAVARYAPNVPGAIIHRQVITPGDLARDYGLTEGNVNHGELTLDQLYFMRPLAGWARYRSPIANLYLCGAGTHAGGGVTCAAGYNASQTILKDASRR